jgi:hypothetical protein
VGWILQIFWPTFCRHFSCVTLVLQATPILLLDLIILIVFVEEYQLQICFYAIFFSLLLLPPSQVQIFSLACCFKSPPPASFDTVMWETMFYSHIKWEARYCAYTYPYCTTVPFSQVFRTLPVFL